MSFKRKIHHALSSDARAETLELLYKKPLDIDELAQKLKLQPVTVRHHIQALLEARLIDTFQERTGLAGRPKVFYKIAPNIPLVTFPARYYQDMTRRLINLNLKKLGKQKTIEILGELGEEMAKETMAILKATNSIKQWNPNNFADIYVNKYLKDIGAEPELIQKTHDQVTYRLHNCIFSELSQENPELLCEAVHKNYSKSLAKNMGENIQITPQTCMGHGDKYCEKIVQWQPKKQ